MAKIPSFAENSYNFNNAGGYGFEFANDTALHKAPAGQVFAYIQINADAIFASITLARGSSATGNSILGATISKGTVLPIRMTQFKLTSGSVIAYRGD